VLQSSSMEKSLVYIILIDMLTLIIGVHIGSNSKSTNRCLAFEGSAVWKILVQAGVIGKSRN
jgi:hypothetical protein